MPGIRIPEKVSDLPDNDIRSVNLYQVIRLRYRQKSGIRKESLEFSSGRYGNPVILLSLKDPDFILDSWIRVFNFPGKTFIHLSDLAVERLLPDFAGPGVNQELYFII